MIEILALVLRLIGVVWAVGAVFIIANAVAMGRSTEARWVLAGGVLTLVAGVLLALAHPWAVIAAVIVAIQQAFFHWRRTRALGGRAPRPTQVWVALAVAATAMLISRAGGFG